MLFILLFKTAVLQPAVTPEILSVVDRIDGAPDREILKRMSDAIFRRHIGMGNHIEILWGLWVCKKYNIEIDESIIIELFKLSHPLCSLMVLDYLNNIRREMLSIPSVKSVISHINATLSASSLYEENWILLYEGAKRGWIGEKRLIEEDSFFKYLLDKDVSFYDEDNRADYSSATYILSLPLKVPKHVVREAEGKRSALMESIKQQFIDEQTLEIDICEDFEDLAIEEEVDQKIEDINISDILFEELLHSVFQGEKIDSGIIVENYVKILREVKDY